MHLSVAGDHYEDFRPDVAFLDVDELLGLEPNENPKICKRCGASFMTQQILTSHLLSECGQVHRCHQCGANFSTGRGLAAHRRRSCHPKKSKS